jgi:hypothetical protein
MSNVLGFGLVIILLSACSVGPKDIAVTPIEIRTVEVSKPKPIVPKVDQLGLKSVKWIIVTPENINQLFDDMNGEKVLFALTSEGYENIAFNLSDIMAMIRQQQKVIAIYKK